MHYSQNRAFSPNFLHSCASSAFDDITKVRGEKSEGVRKQRRSEDDFSLGNTELLSQRGSSTLLKESSCRPGLQTAALTYQLKTSVPKHTLGPLQKPVNTGKLLLTRCCLLYQQQDWYEGLHLGAVRGNVGHFMVFHPLEGRPRGYFIASCPLEGHFMVFHLSEEPPRDSLIIFHALEGQLRGYLTMFYPLEGDPRVHFIMYYIPKVHPRFYFCSIFFFLFWTWGHDESASEATW